VTIYGGRTTMKKILNEWKKYLINEVSQFRDIMRILSGDRQNVQSVGMMTPENPDAQQLSKEENDQLLERFEGKLREMNLGFRRIRGKFGNQERSFIIPNISREEIVELGKEFGQEAVIWGSMEDGKMIYQYIEGDVTKQKRDVVLSGPEIDAQSDFYSQEPGGPKLHSITKPKSGQGGKPMARTARKFVIPFFDEDYEFEEEMSEGIMPELDEAKHEDLIQEISKRISRTLTEGRTKKSRYQNRKIIRYECSKVTLTTTKS
jgi:hypothetical protein